jgi:hypothetical protein
VSKTDQEGGDWGSRSEALFHDSRDDYDPTLADRKRVRDALDRRLGQGSYASKRATELQLPASKRASRWALGKLAKAGIGAACVMVAGSIVLTLGTDSRPRATPRPASIQSGALAAKTRELSGEPTNRMQIDDVSPSHEPADTAQSYAKDDPATRQVSRRRRRVPHVPLPPASALSAQPPTPTSSVPEPTVEKPLAIERQTSARESAAEMRPAAARDAAVVTPNASQAAAQPIQVASPDVARTATENKGTNASNAASDELAFVTRIHVAMMKSQLRSVIALCAEHEHRWPHGTFVQEREALRTIARCGAHVTGAGRGALAFFADYPDSPLAARVRETCSAQLTAAE